MHDGGHYGPPSCRTGQWFAEMGVVTWRNVFVPSPAALTGLLSQMPIELSNMRLKAIFTLTVVPPENTSTPVVWRSAGPGGPSSVSPLRLFLPMELSMITLPFRSSCSPGG